MIRLSEGHFELGGVSFKTGFHFVASWLKIFYDPPALDFQVLEIIGSEPPCTSNFSIQVFNCLERKKSLVLFL